MGRRGPLKQQRDAEGKPLDGRVALAEYVGGAAPAAPVDVPPAPAGLLPEVAVVWQAFWHSRSAQWVDRYGHMARLVRWIKDVDLYTRLRADLEPGERAADAKVLGVVDEQRPWLGKGSTRQVAAHPNAALLAEVDQRIHRAEVEFGMTPYAAVRLAGAGVQGALTAEQLARMLEQRGKAQPTEDEGAPWAAGLRPV